MTGVNIPLNSLESSYKLPYPGGKEYRCSQGNFGSTSHNDQVDPKAIYAFDFDLKVGDLVVASRAGKVLSVQDKFGKGGDSSYKDLVNYVLIDHEDGTSALYLHLQKGSVKVKPGDEIRRGQEIAEVGLSGWITGAHLHFQVQKTPKKIWYDKKTGYNRGWYTQSVRISFSDEDVLRQESDSIPNQGKSYRSSNALLSPPTAIFPKVEVKWTLKEISQPGLFSPSFVSDDGVLYIQGAFLLYAIDVITGKVVKTRSMHSDNERILGISKKAIYLIKGKRKGGFPIGFSFEGPYTLRVIDRKNLTLIWEKYVHIRDGVPYPRKITDYGAFYFEDSSFGLVDESIARILWQKDLREDKRTPQGGGTEETITAVGRKVAILTQVELGPAVIPSGIARDCHIKKIIYKGIDVFNGKTLWERQGISKRTGDPWIVQIIGDNSFLLKENKEDQGRIQLIELETGKLIWEISYQASYASREHHLLLCKLLSIQQGLTPKVAHIIP